MNCRRIRSKLDSYINRELSTNKKQIIQKHLSDCSSCRSELEAVRNLNHALACIGTVKASADFTYRVMNRINSSAEKETLTPVVHKKWGMSFAAAGFIMLILSFSPLLDTFNNIPHNIICSTRQITEAVELPDIGYKIRYLSNRVLSTENIIEQSTRIINKISKEE